MTRAILPPDHRPAGLATRARPTPCLAEPPGPRDSGPPASAGDAPASRSRPNTDDGHATMDDRHLTDTQAGVSIQERVRQSIESEILNRRRLPGSGIDDREIARQFNVSRTPVREALLRLAAEGLVEIVPRAGMFVRRYGAAELVAMLEALAETESVLAKLAARRATDDMLARMDVALSGTDRAADTLDQLAYTTANAELHDVIYASTNNPVLVQQVLSIRKMLAMYRRRGFDKAGRIVESNQEHHRIVAAIRAGDEDRASAEMRFHIDAGGEAMTSLVLMAEYHNSGKGMSDR